MFRVPEDRRIVAGYARQICSTERDGNNGAFILRFGRKPLKPVKLFCIASDGEGWEHVSVSVNTKRCPKWEEMAFVKSVFWGPEDVVMQLHPAESQYVNNHPTTLHLWRPSNEEIPVPDSMLVGIKTLKPEDFL